MVDRNYLHGFSANLPHGACDIQYGDSTVGFILMMHEIKIIVCCNKDNLKICQRNAKLSLMFLYQKVTLMISHYFDKYLDIMYFITEKKNIKKKKRMIDHYFLLQ